MQKVVFKDLGCMRYQEAWDYQERLLQENVRIKSAARDATAAGEVMTAGDAVVVEVDVVPETTHYLLFVEHPPVYTLGKSGHMENVLIGEAVMKERGIEFFRA